MTTVLRSILAFAPVSALAFALAAAPLAAGTPPPGFVETQLVPAGGAGGVWSPTAAAFEPGTGNLFITEQISRVRVRDAVSGVVSTALDLACVDAVGERGILGIAFSPDYLVPGSRHVFLYYIRLIDNAACAVAGQPTGSRIRVSRFTESGGALHSEVVVLEGPFLTAATNHNAGALQFAPDGTLFIATGDNDTDADNNPLSRDLGDLRGKLLRIHPDGTIPADNPFVGQPGARPEIWARGLRNPFRFRFDEDAEVPIIADVGEVTWEAIYRGVAGADYGYPCVEGSHSFKACVPAPAAGSLTDPVYEYGHQDQTPPVSGRSVTGGPIYRADAFPADFRDNYFFGDYGAGWIRRGRFAPDGRLVDVEMFIPDAPWVVDILVSPDGCLVWVSVVGGGVNEVCFVGGANGQPLAVSAADVTSGLAPLNVAFTGSDSTDPDTDPLTYDWQFGDPPASNDADTVHMYSADGVYEAVLTVDDGQGEANSSDSAPPIRIVVGNRAPAPIITSPAADSFYDAGDVVSFSGGATDPEDGSLGAGALSWTVVFHHAAHTHPFLGPLSGVGGASFTVPTDGEDATDVFFRVYLSATDSGAPVGEAARLTATTSVEIRPNVSDLTLAALPAAAGLELEFDRQPSPAPLTRPSVVNFPRTLGAPTPQTTGSGTFFFQSWSDGGAAEHAISTPSSDTTYTATFAPCAAADDDLALSDHDVAGEETETACLTIATGAGYRVVTGGDLTLTAGVSVALGNDFSVALGGQLVVDLTPPI